MTAPERNFRGNPGATIQVQIERQGRAFSLKKIALFIAMVGLVACYRIPEANSVSPAAGSGSQLTFEANYTDSRGAENLQRVGMLVNDVLTGAHACYVMYVPEGNQLVLVKDAGSGGFSVNSGSRGNVENSQCILNADGWTATRHGNELTVRALVTFKPAFSGKKNMYLYAANKQGGQVFRQKGTWMVP